MMAVRIWDGVRTVVKGNVKGLDVCDEVERDGKDVNKMVI